MALDAPKCRFLSLKFLASNKTNYSLPSARTNYGKFNMRFSAIKVWNSLNENLRHSTKAKFKKTLFALILINLHDWIKKHFENSNSSVYKHFITCHNKPNSSKTFISIITREPDPVNLCLHEAFFICKLQPTINSRTELSELSKHLF